MKVSGYLPSQDGLYEAIASANRFGTACVGSLNALPTYVKAAAIAVPLILALGATIAYISDSSRAEQSMDIGQRVSNQEAQPESPRSDVSMQNSPIGSVASSPETSRRDDSIRFLNIPIEELTKVLNEGNGITDLIEEEKTEGDLTCSLHAIYGKWIDQNGLSPQGLEVVSKVTGRPIEGPVLAYPIDGAKGARDLAVKRLRASIAQNPEIKKMYVEDFELWIQAMKDGDTTANKMLGSTTTAAAVVDLQVNKEENFENQRYTLNSIPALIYEKREQLPDATWRLLQKESKLETVEALKKSDLRTFINCFNNCKNSVLQSLKGDSLWQETLDEIDQLQGIVKDYSQKIEQDLEQFAMQENIIEKYLMHVVNNVELMLTNTQLQMVALASDIHLVLIQKEYGEFTVQEVGKNNSTQRIVYLRERHFTRVKFTENFLKSVNWGSDSDGDVSSEGEELNV